MKGLVLYESRAGSTERYARWIAESTGFDCRPVKKAGNLKEYDTVVIGSRVMMGRPVAAKWMVRNQGRLADKRLFYFTVSATLKDDPILQESHRKAFPEELRKRMPYFPLNGKQIFEDMPPFDRKLMQFAIKMTAKENPEEAKKMAEEFDRVNRADLKPLLDRIAG